MGQGETKEFLFKVKDFENEEDRKMTYAHFMLQRKKFVEFYQGPELTSRGMSKSYGACYALTFDYIRRLIAPKEGGQRPKAFKEAYIKDSPDDKERRWRKIVRLQESLRAFDSTPGSEENRQFVRVMGTLGAWKKTASKLSLRTRRAQLSEKPAQTPEERCEAYKQLRITISPVISNLPIGQALLFRFQQEFGTGHCVAVVKTVTHWYFFDANIGAFRATTWANVLEAVCTCYGTSFSDHPILMIDTISVDDRPLTERVATPLPKLVDVQNDAELLVNTSVFKTNLNFEAYASSNSGADPSDMSS